MSVYWLIYFHKDTFKKLLKPLLPEPSAMKDEKYCPFQDGYVPV